ncbi:hypothetical protein [Quadrisphaera setariae]|uniref:Uncharacterized protein n=1 Tax=Quadrisphaera setariae TaxID=2593304 RepID=A0A5C8Z0D0_9ACTN|nr:hypothetical protein [Quadrisphaera setariae]TXR51585.1 hypothetical protein FMM08_22310 [Quadrisphaera setariae]
MDTSYRHRNDRYGVDGLSEVAASVSIVSIGAWRPLDEREAGAAAPEPVLLDGVPEHLDKPLRQWLHGFLGETHHAQRVGLRLHIAARGRWDIKQELLAAEPDALLRVTDAALYWHPLGKQWAERAENEWVSPTQRQDWQQQFVIPAVRLRDMLVDAGSVWTVTTGGRSLQRRVDATVQEAHDAAKQAASTSGRPEAARDLADAWAKTYGLHPEPSEAYRLAIRAVEDVAIPVVLPQDKNATLGKVRTHLRDASARWRTNMGAGAEPVVTMISSLWISQTDRHAGQAELERIDQQAAEQAVHLATTLVQWFAAGHVQRVP